MAETFAVRHYDSIGSTNDEARRLAREGAPHGTVIHADEQRSGRGRLTRTWFSPPGNLYMSILLRIDTPPQRTAELGFVAALAVAETVETLLPKDRRALLKWPNDVLVENAKISGILLEMEDDAVILGIGLNVLEAPSGGKYKTTTLVANGGIASVDSARDILLDRLARFLSQWRTEGFAAIKAAWLERSYPIGEMIRINASGTPLEGRFSGLDDAGALLLETPEGIQKILAGDVVIAG
ncbi:biotin--[acetyl-CoA-carboxylase] ligase [Rhodopila sp.]|jgi:BirA family biotin operon repressor/biotin-[acetyl-CoA-carboxylase] ligase|uniref:biotin--[acetyl-CoA-carboxylase] ligase n=1 Tax=Rhodopila sp. TaxID=2480087 RepID=UPI002B52FC94|nr:biotin--[acetyl-CoA-carboxylase] ligase [Rhodopila sp.]HVZ07582.1 biotin--[acetyl-CoA-carboxylase] ligase [Rhodopila sp.]